MNKKALKELQDTLDISANELLHMTCEDEVQLWASVFQDVRTKIIPKALKEVEGNEKVTDYLNRLSGIIKLFMVQLFGAATDEIMPKISRKSAEIVKFHADKLRKLTDECIG